ncbi:MAG: hypothetical protein FGM33_09280, partial [Candidatus Kapabacteria bacterium]|nr:hypothetical protein [Candidatus Kapabacteria bacterium]
MRGIQTLFLAVIIAIGAIVSNAQVTVYVRSAADGGNNANNGLTAATAKLTIGGANGALTVAGVTTLDIGAGNFAGATTTVPLTINGANAGAAFANWGAATVLTTPITLGAADADIAVDGVTFGAGSTINGASTGANVIASNCKFSAANAVNTTGLGWEELSISGCQFDGNNGGAVANAIIANGLTTLFLTETTFEDYTSSAVTVSGNHENVVMTSNEFTRVNTGGTTSEGAMKIDAAGLSTTGSLRVANNIVSSATTVNGVVVTGALAGKTINLESNLFTGIGGFAIRNDGTGMLSAGCNAYGNNASVSTVMGLLSGAIQAGPYNFGGVDNNGAGIGFSPVGGSCTQDGPVTISGSSNSYFRIQDGVTAVAAGGTVTAGLFTFTENVSVNKSVTITSVTTTDYKRITPWTTLNGTISVSIGAVNFSLVGMKVTSSTATQLVTSSATGSTNITNCLIDVNPTAGLTSVPTNGAIHIAKNGDVTINGTKVGRPTTGSAPFIRALTFGAGNACRNVAIGATADNVFEGTLQFSGMSLLSDVSINNSTISNAGIDGVSFTGNTINTLSITNCDILDSRQNGIGIRDRVTVGNTLPIASVNNCQITGSGKSGSGFAAISIASASFGTQSFTNSILHPQDGSNTPLINGRGTGYAPLMTCNWWGSKSQDVIEASITGGATIDNGSSGWRRATTNTGGNGANFDGNAGCSVRAFTITLTPSPATCFGTATGSIDNTLGGTTAGATFQWSNGAITEDIANLLAGSYTVTVSTASENTRSKSATITQPPVLSATTSKTNITCNSATDGTITVSNPQGGYGTYQFRLNTGAWQSSGSFNNLDAGTYSVQIRDAAFTTCVVVLGDQVITRPAALTATVAKTNITCFTATDGTITVTNPQGGYGTYQYRLNTGAWQSSGSFANLDAGTYSVQIRDAAQVSCVVVLGNQVVTRPAAVTSNITGTATICSGGSTNLTITFNGVAPFSFSINNGASQNAPSSPHTVSVSPSSTTTYTVTSVTDANGCSALAADRTGSAIVTLNTVTAGVIASDQTICSGDNAAAFTVPTAATGAGALTYQWQVSTSFPTPSWSNISGATGAIFDEGTLTADAQYRRIVTSTLNSVACSAVSNTLTVTVNNLVAGSISADQTICEGGDPVAFASTAAATGDGTITYQWQQNTSFPTASWSNVSGATSATYDQGVLTADAQYRRIATSTLNSVACTAVSNTVTVTVNNLVAGSISADQTICEGGDPAAFTSVAATGDGTITYQWQQNTSFPTASWSNVSGATSATYDQGVLTADAQYRRIATSTLNSVACT